MSGTKRQSDGGLTRNGEELSPNLLNGKRRKLTPDGSNEVATTPQSNEDVSQNGLHPLGDNRRPSRGAENGIIESITCTNFMCHSHLHVELNPLINFVIGHNGSGKSAVLTALTVCLGGKASSTNRASTLKAFVKEGQDSSTIAVKIKNKDGFQHEVYGDSILVERTFNRAGASGFKIKSVHGKTISTTKTILDEILDFYALQLDNPICVLSQDMARQFLHNSSASDKYKFFIKGVQLEQMNQDYELLQENIESIEQTHEKKDLNLQRLREKDYDASKRLKLLERQEDMDNRIISLSAQMAWVQVEEQEKLLSDAHHAVSDAQTAIQSSEAGVQQASSSFESLEQALQLSIAESDEIEKEAGPHRSAMDEAKDASKEAGKELEDARSEARRVLQHLRTYRDRENKLKSDILEEEKKLSEASGGAATARLARLKQCNEAAEHLKKELDCKRAATAQFLTDEESSRRAWQELQQSTKGAESELESAKQHLRKIQTRGSHQDYPPNMNLLRQAIKADRGFKRPPVGPLGDHLSLRQPKWATVLENVFNTALNTFIVTSKGDRDHLSILMEKTGCKCPISIQRSVHRLDISSNEPPLEYDTMSRVLQIDENLVFNYLVINQRIEQVILVENEKDAQNLMASRTPKNVKACFAKDSRNPRLARNIAKGITDNVTNTYVDLRLAPSRIKIDINDQIKAQENTIRALEQNKSNLERQNYKARSAYETHLKAKQKHLKEVDDLKTKVEIATDNVDAAQEDVDKGSIEEGRLAALQDGLKGLADDIRGFERALESTIEAKDRAKEDLGKLEQDRKTAEARLQAFTIKLGKAAQARRNLEDQRIEALRAKNLAHSELEAKQEELRSRVREEEKRAAVVLDWTSQASDLYPRCAIPEGETSVTLDHRLKKLIAERERYQKDLGGDRATLLRTYAESHAAFESFRSVFEAEKDLLSLLKRTLNERQERWLLFRKHIAARAKTKFMYLLAERAFKGRLLVDHNNRLMDLLVQPNDTESQAAARQTKTLSGGEKSFSTICLLLALWEAIGAPIRCLDEFDVFMDSANRDISMKLLINAARGSHDRQFIFITPQSMSSVEGFHDVKIIKMRDPERGQTALTVSNQGH